MMADSPVTFPQTGALPAIYPPDRPSTERETPEEGYYIFTTPERSLEQIATIQGAMPAGTFTPPPGDWGPLALARATLTGGGELHILALGDSIVNDTMRSGWVAKLQEAYPKASIRATVYVRGGGGIVWHSRDSRTKIPRRVTEVDTEWDCCARMLAWPRSPRRPPSMGSQASENPSGAGAGTLYSAAS